MRDRTNRCLAGVLAFILAVFNGAAPVCAAAAATEPIPTPASKLSPMQVALLVHVRDLAVDLITTPMQINPDALFASNSPGLLAPGIAAGPDVQPLTIGPDDLARFNTLIAGVNGISSPKAGPLALAAPKLEAYRLLQPNDASAAIASLAQTRHVSIAPRPSDPSGEAAAGVFESLRAFVDALRENSEVPTSLHRLYELGSKINQNLPLSRQSVTPPHGVLQLAELTPPSSNPSEPTAHGMGLPLKFTPELVTSGEKGARTLQRLFDFAHARALRLKASKQLDASVFQLALDTVLLTERLESERFDQWLNWHGDQKRELIRMIHAFNEKISCLNVKRSETPLPLLDPSLKNVEVWVDQEDVNRSGKQLAALARRTLRALAKSPEGQAAEIHLLETPLREIGAFALQDRIVFLQKFRKQADTDQVALALLTLHLGVAGYAELEIPDLLARIAPDLMASIAASEPAQATASTKDEDVAEPKIEEEIPPLAPPAPPPTWRQLLSARVKSLIVPRSVLRPALRVAIPSASLGAALSAHFLAVNDWAAFCLSLAALFSHIIGGLFSNGSKIVAATADPAGPVSIPVHVVSDTHDEDDRYKVGTWDMGSALVGDFRYDNPKSPYLSVNTKGGEIILGIESSGGKGADSINIAFQMGKTYHYFNLVSEDDYSPSDENEMPVSVFRERFWPELKEALQKYIGEENQQEENNMKKFLRRFGKALRRISSSHGLSQSQISETIRGWDIESAELSELTSRSNGSQLRFKTKDGKVILEYSSDKSPGDTLNIVFEIEGRPRVLNIVSEEEFAQYKLKANGLSAHTGMITASKFRELFWPALQKAARKDTTSKIFIRDFSRALEKLGGDEAGSHS